MDKDVKKPFISIIMPAYNAEKFVYKAISSVLSQTYINWELIVVDDGSTDTTAAIVKEFEQKDRRIKYYYQQNKRQAAARNFAISLSRGEWIAFFDADDLWISTKLKIQTEYFKKFPADCYYTGGFIIDEYDHIISDYKTNYGFFTGIEMYKRLYSYNLIPILSAIVRKNWIIKIGEQNEYLETCEDLDYWLRLAKNGADFYGIDEKLFMYRVNPDGTSRNTLQIRVGYAKAFINNFDDNFFTKEDAKKIFSPFMSVLLIELVRLNKMKEIDYLLTRLLKILPLFRWKIKNLLIKILKRNAYFPLKVFNKLIGSLALLFKSKDSWSTLLN